MRVRCLAQGHLGTQLEDTGDRTSNHLVTSQPALPPEPQCRRLTLLFLLWCDQSSETDSTLRPGVDSPRRELWQLRGGKLIMCSLLRCVGHSDSLALAVWAELRLNKMAYDSLFHSLNDSLFFLQQEGLRGALGAGK